MMLGCLHIVADPTALHTLAQHSAWCSELTLCSCRPGQREAHAAQGAS